MHKLARLLIPATALTAAWACEQEDSGPDAALEDGLNLLSVSDVHGMLPGQWQSQGDAKVVVTFEADGKTNDTYDGALAVNGTWLAYSEASSDYILLQKTIEGFVYKYSILSLDQEHLSLSHLPRGNTLDYRRLP